MGLFEISHVGVREGERERLDQITWLAAFAGLPPGQDSTGLAVAAVRYGLHSLQQVTRDTAQRRQLAMQQHPSPQSLFVDALPIDGPIDGRTRLAAPDGLAKQIEDDVLARDPDASRERVFEGVLVVGVDRNAFDPCDTGDELRIGDEVSENALEILDQPPPARAHRDTAARG